MAQHDGRAGRHGRRENSGRRAGDVALWAPTLDDLGYLLQLAYGHLRQTGHEMTPQELRVALRPPL